MVEHDPYKSRYQHDEQPFSLLYPTNQDASVTTGQLSGTRQQVYPPLPKKIGVPFRTRRKRHYHETDDDSDVSVISFNSDTTFGRFSQYEQPSQRPDSTEQLSQSLSLQSTTIIPYPRQSPSAIQRNTSDNNHESVSRPTPYWPERTPLENHADHDIWTAINDLKSYRRTQQLSPTPSRRSVDTGEMQNQKDAGGKSTNNLIGDHQLGPKAQVSYEKVIDVVTDSEDEDEQQLLSLHKKYKEIPRIRDNEVRETILWATLDDIDDSTSQNQSSIAAITNQLRTTTKTVPPMKEQQKNEQQENVKASPPSQPSQISLGKRPVKETDQYEQDVAPMDLEQHISPTNAADMKNRSPSAVPFDFADDEDIDRNWTTTDEQQEKSIPRADDVNPFDLVDDEIMEEESQLRIDSHANLARKLMNKTGTLTKSSSGIPMVVTKSLFESALPHGVSLKSGNTKALMEASNLYFRQLFGDLEAYAEHAGEEADIGQKDMELLMIRQRLLTETTSLDALAHEHLPREFWDQLCVSALAQNHLHPKWR